MNKIDLSNPISGLSANQIILLLEKGSGSDLSENQRELAISAISEHLRFVPEATVESSIHALSRVGSLKYFASMAHQLFFGNSLGGSNFVEEVVYTRAISS